MFARDIRTVFLVFLLAFVLLQIYAFPISPAGTYRAESVPDDDSSPTMMQPLYDFFEQTKNFGQQVVERVSDFSSSVVDYVSEFFAQARQETDDFLNRGGEFINDGIEEARNYGQRRIDEGMLELKKFGHEQVKSAVDGGIDSGWSNIWNQLRTFAWE